MPGFENFIAQTFRAPNPAEVDRARYSNSLARNQVDRIPQANKAQDLAIQASELEIGDAQKKNAAGVLGRTFDLAASSAKPVEAYRAMIASPDFQAAGKILGLPVEQFTFDGTETPETVVPQLQAWSQALRGGAQQRVQSTQVLEDGTIAYMTSDGQLVRTNERARNPLQVIEAAGGKAAFDPRTGGTRPLTTSQQEIDAAAAKKAAETEATQSVTPADTRAAAAAKSPRLAAAARRLDRVKEASVALGTGGGPLEGRAREMVGTPAAQELEAANAQLINELTALTRIPGVGSQSDLEQRLAALQLPNATQHPSVRARSIKELEAFLADLGAALDSVSGQGSPNNDPLGIR